MKYANPNEDPTSWLIAVMLDLLKQDTNESKVDLTSAIKTVVSYLEPGLISQAFGPWIDQYMELLDQHESSHSNDSLMYSPVDQPELLVESETVDGWSHQDKEDDARKTSSLGNPPSTQDVSLMVPSASRF